MVSFKVITGLPYDRNSPESIASRNSMMFRNFGRPADDDEVDDNVEDEFSDVVATGNIGGSVSFPSFGDMSLVDKVGCCEGGDAEAEGESYGALCLVRPTICLA